MSTTENNGIAASSIPSDLPAYITAEYLAESRDAPPVAAILFIISFTSVIVALRFYARGVMVKRLGWDDFLAGLSLAFFVAFVVLCILLINLGSGRHIEYIQYVMSQSVMNDTESLDFYAHILYTTALFVCRMSGLFFYYRLCDRHHSLVITTYAAGVFLVAGYLPQLFLLIFHCKPVTSLWPYPWQEGAELYTCLMWGTVYVTNSAISLVCDVILFAIPATLIVMLRGSMSRKIGLSLVLFPGVIVIAISIARLYLVIQGQWIPDGSWVYSPMLAIETAEVGGTLIALSVPGLKPLFGRWLSRLDATRQGPSTYGYGESKERSAKSGYGLNSGQDQNSRRHFQRAASNEGFDEERSVGVAMSTPPEKTALAKHYNDSDDELIVSREFHFREERRKAGTEAGSFQTAVVAGGRDIPMRQIGLVKAHPHVRQESGERFGGRNVL